MLDLIATRPLFAYTVLTAAIFGNLYAISLLLGG